MEGFIKTDNGDDMKTEAGNLLQYSTKTHRIFSENYWTLTVIYRCPISIQVGVGPGQFHLEDQDEFNWKTPALKRDDVELAKPLFIW